MAKSAKRTKTKTKTKIAARKKTKLPKRKAKAKKAIKKTAKKAVKKTTAKKITKKQTKKAPVALATTAPLAVKSVELQVGEAAPNFTLNNQSGQPVTLSQFSGRKIVLYFYPKDDTPGCTKEACSFRDNIGHIDTTDATILGVSFDDQASHQKFIEKYGLNFQLLSDLDKSVAQAYGVYVQKNMYGNISWGIQRSTFIIDREGKIATVFRKVNVDGHTEEVLAALKAIA